MERIDLCISFDTTGSMYPCLTQVRRNLIGMTNKLFEDIPELRMSVIAHGDYCDANNPYTIKILDFTNNQKRIVDFIRDVEPTYGGDPDECYELVLNQARTQISWEAGTKKILMVVGDANPHGPNYPDNRNQIDWMNEAKLLGEAGVQIHGVHCLPGCRQLTKKFYQTISEITNGIYLTLDQFADITNLIMAACYQQESEEALNEFVTIIRSKGQFNRSLQQNIQRLTGKVVSIGNPVQKNGLIPVPSGRFQVMPITERTSIKAFIEENGIKFQKGRAFYQLTKTETVAQYKELILKDKATGELFNGSQVREILGLLPQVDKGGAKEKIKPIHLDEYDVFIQSTSYNRVVPFNTSILYEVPDWEM